MKTTILLATALAASTLPIARADCWDECEPRHEECAAKRAECGVKKAIVKLFCERCERDICDYDRRCEDRTGYPLPPNTHSIQVTLIANASEMTMTGNGVIYNEPDPGDPNGIRTPFLKLRYDPACDRLPWKSPDYACYRVDLRSGGGTRIVRVFMDHKTALEGETGNMTIWDDRYGQVDYRCMPDEEAGRREREEGERFQRRFERHENHCGCSR